MIDAVGALVVVEPIGKAPPAQAGPLAAALGGVVVHHIDEHLETMVVAGRNQLTQLLPPREWVTSADVAVVGGKPTQGAVAPIVLAAIGGIGGVKGHRRQQLNGSDPQALQIGQCIDQPQKGAPVLSAGGAMAVAAEAAGMQLIDHRFTPSAPGPRVAIEIKVIALSDHRLEAMGAVVVIAGGQSPLVDIPAADGAGAGIQQHFGGVKTRAG